MQATELKHGLKSGNPPWQSCQSGGRRGRSYGTNQVDGKKKEAYVVYGESHAIWRAECVISTDVRIGITYCYMETKQETYLSLVHRELSLNQPKFSEPEQTNKARKSKQLS